MLYCVCNLETGANWCKISEDCELGNCFAFLQGCVQSKFRQRENEMVLNIIIG